MAMDPFSIVSAKRMLDYGKEIGTRLEELLAALEEVDKKMDSLMTSAVNAQTHAPKIGAVPPSTFPSTVSSLEEVIIGNKNYTSMVRNNVLNSFNSSLNPVSTYFHQIQTTILASQDDLETQSTKVICSIGQSLDNLVSLQKNKPSSSSSFSSSTPSTTTTTTSSSSTATTTTSPSSTANNPKIPPLTARPPLRPHANRPPPLTDRPSTGSVHRAPPRPVSPSGPGMGVGLGSGCVLSEKELEGVAKAVAISSYTAKNSKNEFSLEKGDVMYILDQTDSTWWIACRHNRIAQVPSSAVLIISKGKDLSPPPPLPSRVAPPPLPSLKRMHKRTLSGDNHSVIRK